MARDDRFFAVTVANANGPRSSIRRFTLKKHWIKFLIVLVLGLGFFITLGFYGLFQQTNHLRTKRENSELREENEKQQQQLRELNQRINAIEQKSKQYDEMTGLNNAPVSESNDSGGPSFPINSMEDADALVARTAQLEAKLRAVEAPLKEKVKIPSVWPIQGLLNDNFGGRRNPTGGGYEFHAGQDIKVDTGTPVVAAAEGKIIMAGYQAGYGYLVEIDHGNGMTTRYGHLSKVSVQQYQIVKRGEFIGESGNSGRSTGPHLHYEVRINNQPVDPALYLPDYDKTPRKGKE
jgi:murein DD-endopeptidase MepM/ murein hydrolase activator NlpD